MYQPKRPGPVTAVAILCLVFGGLGLVLYLCGMGGFGVIGYLVANPPPLQPGQPDVVGLIKKIDQILPNVRTFFGVMFVITWILCLIELIAGLRLLKMRYSGRKLALIYAVGAILMELAGLGINVALIQPHSAELTKAMTDWMQESMPKPAGNAAGGPAPKEQAPPAGGAPAMPMNPFGGDPVLSAVMSVGGLAVGLLYPGIIILIMMMPSIRRAFAIANGDAPPPDDADADVVRPAGAKGEPPPVSGPEDEYRYQARDE